MNLNEITSISTPVTVSVPSEMERIEQSGTEAQKPEYLLSQGWQFYPSYFRYQWSHLETPDLGFVDLESAWKLQTQKEIRLGLRQSPLETAIGSHSVGENLRCDVYALKDGIFVEFRYVELVSEEEREVFRVRHATLDLERVVSALLKIQVGNP